MDAVPPPFLPSLVENKKLQGLSENNWCIGDKPGLSSKKIETLLSRIRPLTRKVLFKSERRFKRPELMVGGEIKSFVADGRDFSKLI